MMNINLTSKKTGKVTTLNVPNCIGTPMYIVGLAAGVGTAVGFCIGLVEDATELVKKLRKK